MLLNTKLISKIIGSLLGLEGLLMLISLLVSLIYRGVDTMAFVWSILITMGSGLLCKLYGSKADNNMSRKDAYFVVTLAWVLFSFFGALPFLISGYIGNLTDAFFETMSGFSTTGATILDYPEWLPKGLLFWRSLTHWIGGLGIVFFTIAILPSLVGGSVKVFSAEATGPIKSKLHPRLSTSSRWIWSVYFVLTIASFVSYKLCGMSWFDAWSYAMSTTATGGFGTAGTSIMGFHSVTLEYVVAVFCFLSGVNFSLLYAASVGLDVKSLIKNSEVRFYTGVVLGLSVFIAYWLYRQQGYDLEHSFREAFFQVVSIITTTGFYSDDAGKWPHITWAVLALCMFLGGCSGSTSGGVKSIRMVMLLKVMRNEFKQILHPSAVLPLKIDGTNVTLQQRVTLLSFIGVYLALLLVSTVIFVCFGIESTDAMTLGLSSLGNVGPVFGSSLGPTMSWASIPDAAKWLCSILMLIGRLELFTVLVLFSPEFWKNR